MRQPLPREEVIKAIKFGKPSRVPMLLHMWHWAGVHGDRQDEAEAIQRDYPMDVKFVNLWTPSVYQDTNDPGYLTGYSWMPSPPPPPSEEAAGIDGNVLIKDWRMLDEMLAQWPDPSNPELYAKQAEDIATDAQCRYVLLAWWFCLYERLWSFRGMDNILCEFYEYPDEVRRLMDAITDFDCALIRAASQHLKADGIFTSDDIGMQTGPMFSPAIFEEFFKPRYAKIFQTAHECGLHFWLHTCGNIRPFLPHLIEIGLDVIHPIQRYTMDEREIAEEFGGQICFWTGMDVQQILPNGTPEEVRQEVRFMIDTYDRPEGGCIITAGNGVGGDVPVENALAFYDEAYTYGLAHRAQYK